MMLDRIDPMKDNGKYMITEETNARPRWILFNKTGRYRQGLCQGRQ
ncbi:MAG: hypothetical protein KJO91_04090 [Gammaproteobacteria bacterium]|nr:hypothetical protein [Gammaproteobacteria bacterium]